LKERLQKILASRGYASRRAAEEIITAGRVVVNGEKVTELGTRADAEFDQIRVDGKPLLQRRPARVLMLNKPPGYLSTCHKSREEGRVILELIPSDRRYFPVGRLDRDSSGLLLVTDDGDLAQRLTHPSHGTRKIYLVEATTRVEESQVRELREGIDLEDGFAQPDEVAQLSSRRLQITLTEGRNREVRRLFAAVGLRVRSLQRIQIANLKLGSLPPGHWRDLTLREIERLVHPAAPSTQHEQRSE
jgi:23S rRNA pseudouridine2605 synthase